MPPINDNREIESKTFRIKFLFNRCKLYVMWFSGKSFIK